MLMELSHWLLFLKAFEQFFCRYLRLSAGIGNTEVRIPEKAGIYMVPLEYCNR